MVILYTMAIGKVVVPDGQQYLSVSTYSTVRLTKAHSDGLNR